VVRTRAMRGKTRAISCAYGNNRLPRGHGDTVCAKELWAMCEICLMFNLHLVEQHYGYPVDVEWVISRHRRAGDPVCIVQSRPVTVAAPVSAAPAVYDPVARAQKYVFSGKPIPGR